MIVVTGAAGFIGSCLIRGLNEQQIGGVIAVDDFSRPDKLMNLSNKQVSGVVHRKNFQSWLRENHQRVGHIFHLGARTDTTESDHSVFDELNLNFSKKVWEACHVFQIPLSYASSAATYGDGTLGYNDDHDVISKLHPLNPYGQSKNTFDLWAHQQTQSPPVWHGLKFFNVYGPNEYHKGRMASVILHAFNQISETGKMNLFRSHRSDFADGHQSRDFVYVEDIVAICIYCMQIKPASGIYNAGTGKARTFLDLVNATFSAMNVEPRIEFIDTPGDIRDKYQYFTEADMTKLRNSGYHRQFTSLESGVQKYVRSYLVQNRFF